MPDSRYSWEEAKKADLVNSISKYEVEALLYFR